MISYDLSGGFLDYENVQKTFEMIVADAINVSDELLQLKTDNGTVTLSLRMLNAVEYDKEENVIRIYYGRMTAVIYISEEIGDTKYVIKYSILQGDEPC